MFKRPDYPGRVADGDGAWRDILCHDGSGSYDAPLADGDSGKQYRTSSNPYLILDADWFGEGIAPEGGIRIVAAVADSLVRGVSGGVYFHVRRYQDTVSDVDAVVIDESAVHVDNHIVADVYIPSVFAMEVNVDMNVLPHAAEEFPKYQLPGRGIIIVAGVKQPYQPLCTQGKIQ